MVEIELVKSMMDDLDELSLKGLADWERGINLAKKLIALKKEFDKQAELREKAYQQSLEDAKKRREQQLKEAKERGEEIVGGETIRIKADGSQEVVIP